MKLLKTSASTALLAGALALTGVTGAAHAQVEVKIGYGLPTSSHMGYAAQKWQEFVEAETEGRYRFNHFPSAALGGEREVAEAVQLGTVEATVVSTGPLPSFVPEVGVFDIPYLFRDLGHARRVLDGPIGQEMLKNFEEAGLIALAWGEMGFTHISNNRNAIAAPADLAGLKIRTVENPIHITAFETLGAAPTPMAWPEVFSALQQGTVDGALNPMATILSAKLPEVQTHLTMTDFFYPAVAFLVSQALWDEMTKEDQEIFRRSAVAAAAAQREFIEEIEKAGVEQVKADGMTVGVLSPEQKAEFRQKLEPAYEQFAVTFGSELLDAIAATE